MSPSSSPGNSAAVAAAENSPTPAAAAAAKKNDDDEPSSPSEEVERRRWKGSGKQLRPPTPSLLLRGEGVSEIGAQRAISPGESAPRVHVEGGAGWMSLVCSAFFVSFFFGSFDCNPPKSQTY